MFCRGFSWFVRIFVAVVISTGCSHPVSVTEFYTEVTAHSLTTNKEALTVGRVQEAEEATAEDLGALLDAGDGAVVTLLAGDTRLVAHRAVLAARSPVFAGMLRRLTLEASSSSQLTLSDTEGPVLRQVLAYLYTLQPLQLPSMAPQLMVAADKYGLSVLKAHCEQQVASQLSVETAAATGVLAIRHSANMLKQAAVAFIKSHLLRVVATQGWGEAVVNDPQTVVELTHLIAETPTDTSTPSAGESRTGPSSQPHSGHSDDGRSPATAVPPTSPQATPQPDDAADSHLRLSVMEHLIQLLQDNPVLYNTSHPDYMQNKLKDEIWKKVAEELHYSNCHFRCKSPRTLMRRSWTCRFCTANVEEMLSRWQGRPSRSTLPVA
ncbi:protein roadkill-like isoform X3 [Schistocerca piceifrons]|uniref:protein roadkill-like isoform X3 n=1 Tax=Schistocerca piceifrons TaxID=274613 RepID=UPI001F5F5F49|nr:protein roadkill-like isoform X3 [Schistocerca piceifrons]